MLKHIANETQSEQGRFRVQILVGILTVVASGFASVVMTRYEMSTNQSFDIKMAEAARSQRLLDEKIAIHKDAIRFGTEHRLVQEKTFTMLNGILEFGSDAQGGNKTAETIVWKLLDDIMGNLQPLVESQANLSANLSTAESYFGNDVKLAISEYRKVAKKNRDAALGRKEDDKADEDSNSDSDLDRILKDVMKHVNMLDTAKKEVQGLSDRVDESTTAFKRITDAMANEIQNTANL